MTTSLIRRGAAWRPRRNSGMTQTSRASSSGGSEQGCTAIHGKPIPGRPLPDAAPCRGSTAPEERERSSILDGDQRTSGRERHETAGRVGPSGVGDRSLGSQSEGRFHGVPALSARVIIGGSPGISPRKTQLDCRPAEVEVTGQEYRMVDVQPDAVDFYPGLRSSGARREAGNPDER